MSKDKEQDIEERELDDVKKEKEKTKKAKAPKGNELLEKVAELESKLLYMQADYQNFRKRTAKDITDARVVGTANALEPFLKVNDFLGMAQMAAEKSDNIEAIRQGILMIINEYNKAMDELGVTKLNTLNAKFDPTLHDAISEAYSDTVPEGKIIKEFTSGYKLGERLLRPARVVVSKGVEPVEVTPEEANSSENFQD